MEPYSSYISRESREDSLDYRPRSIPRINGTDSFLSSLTAISTRANTDSISFGITSSTSAPNQYHPLAGQAQSSQPQNQIPGSQFTASSPQFNHYSQHSRQYISGSPQSPPSAGLQSWDHPVPSQGQSSDALLQLNRNRAGSIAKEQYESGAQQSLQANMRYAGSTLFSMAAETNSRSMMGAQYFPGMDQPLGRSVHTWPGKVFSEIALFSS